MRTMYILAQNKGCISKFPKGYWIQQLSKECQILQQPKHCNETKDDDVNIKASFFKHYFYFLNYLQLTCYKHWIIYLTDWNFLLWSYHIVYKEKMLTLKKKKNET